MLVLTRKTGEAVLIDEDVCMTIEEIRGDKVRISIKAPKDVKILRKELSEAQEINKESLTAKTSSIKALKGQI